LIAGRGREDRHLSLRKFHALMEITPLGDSALTIRVDDRFKDAPEKTLKEVLNVIRRLEDAHIPGIIELAPAYTTVGVFFDPIRVINCAVEPDSVIEWLTQKICEGLAHGKRKQGGRAVARVVEVPVCYDPEFALDLDHVAQHAQMSPKEVVDLHHATEYHVYCIGFTPGFPYLGGLPEKLATPRHATPRKEIPAGSVAIGGRQSGIYPLRSPGGWNVIGRTPLRLFDPQTNPPALLRTGDRLRFQAISRQEFETWTF
jgi:inhibitor of KinA